jgi:hypothetical protein
VQLPPSLRPSPRGWMLPAFFQVLQIVTFCVLLGVGLHIDHARIPTGPITWLAALGLASIWAPFIRRQWRLEQDWRREQERRLAENPEAQLGALVLPVVRRAGITNVTEAIAEIGALADTRLQRQLAEGKERRDDDRDDQAR